jgi:hypothetical protein
MTKNSLAQFDGSFLPAAESNYIFSRDLAEFQKRADFVAEVFGDRVYSAMESERNFWAFTLGGFKISSNGYVCRA